MLLNKQQKQNIARRIARAITDACARGDLPNETDLQEAILYILDEEDRKALPPSIPTE